MREAFQRLEARTDEKLRIHSRVLDADGNPMMFAKHGVTQKYADPSVVSSRRDVR